MKSLTILTLALAGVLASRAAAQMPVPPGVDQGRGLGAWCVPTPTGDGMVDGLLYASDGTPRYTMKGHVLDAGSQRAGAWNAMLAPVLQTGTDPYPMWRMLVLGSWTAPDGDHGQFDGLILMTFRDLPLPAVLGMLEGSFDLTPEMERPMTPGERARAAMVHPRNPRFQPPAATKGPGLLLHPGARLAQPEPTSIVIVCPKRPDLQRHPGARPAEPTASGRLQPLLRGQAGIGGVQPHAPAAPAKPYPLPEPDAPKLGDVSPAGPHAPAGPVQAGGIRRGPFDLRWFLDA